jgi:hypothetical protein
MGYSVKSIEDIEGTGPGGAVRFVRRELRLGAFGINWFELAPGAVTFIGVGARRGRYEPRGPF